MVDDNCDDDLKIISVTSSTIFGAADRTDAETDADDDCHDDADVDDDRHDDADADDDHHAALVDGTVDDL